MQYEDFPDGPEGRGIYLARMVKHYPPVLPAVLSALTSPPAVAAKRPGAEDAALAGQILVDHMHRKEVLAYIREMLSESSPST